MMRILIIFITIFFKNQFSAPFHQGKLVDTLIGVGFRALRITSPGIDFLQEGCYKGGPEVGKVVYRRNAVPTIINYIVKVEDARIGQVKKALESANIKVISIIDVYKEDRPSPPSEARQEGQAKQKGASSGS